MPLQPVAGTAGLWRDPAWKADMPGVYALIVGASAYPHLDGGDPQVKAQDTFNMGQLVSSARTAADLFRWLCNDFRRQDLPLIWCQLLLSPTAQERAAIDPAILAHHAPADDASFRKAIRRWTSNVPTADLAAGQSRTLFFFSGHGVLSNFKPVMLPSDYLDSTEGTPVFENCINTRELLEWMDQSPVAEHLALIDACQNQFSPLASKGAMGNSCFPINTVGGKVPRTSAALSSSALNTIAYQAEEHVHTFFGAAVLEALRGAPGSDSRLEFRELVDYVRPRVNVLLREAGGTAVEQTVRQRIEGDDGLVVTEIKATASPAAPAALGPPTPLDPVGIEQPRVAVLRAKRTLRQPLDLAVPKAAVIERFDAKLAVRQPIRLDAMRKNLGQIHDRMGHEYASYPWQNGMALYSLQDGELIQDDETEVKAVERNDASSLVQVDLALAPRLGGVLLVFEGVEYVQRERLALALPTDTEARVPIRLALTFGKVPANAAPRIQRIEARLGPSSDGGHYQYLWGLTREADLGSLREAARQADPQRLKEAAERKGTNQTAAVAGMLLLARAGRIADVHDWTRNLMNWFPDIPDGAVLWAESLRAAMARDVMHPFGVADPIDEMAGALGLLAQRGIPFFSDVLELADSLLRFALRHPLAEGRKQRLLEVRTLLDRVLGIAMPSGHFMALAGLPRPAFLGQGDLPLAVAELLEVLGRKR